MEVSKINLSDCILYTTFPESICLKIKVSQSQRSLSMALLTLIYKAIVPGKVAK